MELRGDRRANQPFLGLFSRHYYNRTAAPAQVRRAALHFAEMGRIIKR